MPFCGRIRGDGFDAACHLRTQSVERFDVPAPDETGHGYGFYVESPGGFTVELGA